MFYIFTERPPRNVLNRPFIGFTSASHRVYEDPVLGLATHNFNLKYGSYRLVIRAIAQIALEAPIGPSAQAVSCRGLLLKAARTANVVMSGG